MSFFQTIILAIVEGITEFLPVSSTGHLILTGKIMGIIQSDFTKSFEIFIQTGAILAIIFLYKKKISKDITVLKKISAAFIPTAIVGLILYKFIKKFLLGSWLITVITLFIGGILIIIFEKLLSSKKAKYMTISELPYSSTVILGVLQSLSVVPGVSRAAATIFGGMFLGLSRTTAVEASFLLAIPTIFAATFLDLIKTDLRFSLIQLELLLTGLVVSFITSYFTAKYLLSFIKKHNFTGFGIYRIILAVIYFIIFAK